METQDPHFTCGDCKKTWTLWGRVDMKELDSSYPHCPWCGKVIKILYNKETEDD